MGKRDSNSQPSAWERSRCLRLLNFSRSSHHQTHQTHIALHTIPAQLRLKFEAISDLSIGRCRAAWSLGLRPRLESGRRPWSYSCSTSRFALYLVVRIAC